jgi:hypothetical protein
MAENDTARDFRRRRLCLADKPKGESYSRLARIYLWTLWMNTTAAGRRLRDLQSV